MVIGCYAGGTHAADWGARRVGKVVEQGPQSDVGGMEFCSTGNGGGGVEK